jgi:site-specific DNA recombinase
MTDAIPTETRKEVVARGKPVVNVPSERGVAGSYRAVVYLRVSTAGQVNTDRDAEGFSIPAQREACYRKAEAMEAEVVDEYVDAGESARSADRPQLQTMLERLISERDVDFVIVHKVDRLARSRADDVTINLAIQEAGARLVSVSENIDETPSGMLLHGIMSTIAEFYSQNLSTEIIKGMGQKAKKGGYPHKAPIGYVNRQNLSGGHNERWIETDDERAPLITWAFEAYVSGDYTLRQLTAALADKGLTSVPTTKRPSRALTPQRVHTMLANRFYVGLVTWQGIEYAGRHDPLIAVETFAKVQALMHSRAQSKEKAGKHRHYLKGSLLCARCHGSMGFTRAKGHGGTYEYFFCWNRVKGGGCDLPYVDVDMVEAQVVDRYELIQLGDSSIRSIRKALLTYVSVRNEGTQDEGKRAQQRIDGLQAERRKLIEMRYADAIPLALLKEEQDRISRQLGDAQSDLAKTVVDWKGFEKNLNAALGFAGKIGHGYADANSMIRRRINQAVLKGIYVDIEGVTGLELSDPMAQLMAEDLVDQIEVQIAKTPGVQFAGGSRMIDLVEMMGLEPTTPCLQIGFLGSPTVALRGQTANNPRLYGVVLRDPPTTVRSRRRTATGL